MVDIKSLDKVFSEDELEYDDGDVVSGIVPVVRPGFSEPPMDSKKFLSLVDDPKVLFDFDKTKLTPLQQAYIMAYAVRGTKTQACKVSGVTLSMVDKWMKESEEFRQALQNAVDVVADALEEEAMRRALKGSSDKLLVELLKATRPEKYDRKTQNINVNGAVVHSWADLALKASQMIDADYEVKEEIEDEDKDTEEE